MVDIDRLQKSSIMLSSADRIYLGSPQSAQSVSSEESSAPLGRLDEKS